MHLIQKNNLPFIGSSYNFVGADQGDVGVSMFFVEAKPGEGAPLHFHDYDEIVVVPEGNSRLVIGDELQDAVAGNILVVKARTPHGFVNTGEGLLKQIDIHVNPRFKQQLLEVTETSQKANLPLPR